MGGTAGVDHRIAIVGAGFSGIGAALALREAGIEDFAVLERASAIGGTWRENVYPGCACDVPSSVYGLSFAPKPDWSRSFAPAAEIRGYLEECARAGGVSERIELGRAVHGLRWEDGAGRWRIETDAGERTAQVAVLATGPLSEPAIPRLPGLGAFSGAVFHSARWDTGRDLRGARVAVVGTGASAAQIVPHLAGVAGELTVYQRTPAWVLPRRDRALGGLEHALYRTLPAAQRAARAGTYWGRELLYPVLRSPLAGALAERLAARHLRDQIRDPALRAALTPEYRIGCKRILLSDDLYPALAHPRTTLVPHAVRELTADGVIAADGVERPADVVVLATGFRIGAALAPARIHGREGTLARRWSAGASAYNGTTVAGFPNLAILLGPHTGLGHNSVLVMLEAQLRYLVGMLDALQRGALRSLEPRVEAQARFEAMIRRRSRRLVFERGGCSSWYLDGAGHSLLWPGPSFTFVRRLRRFDLERYEARSAP